MSDNLQELNEAYKAQSQRVAKERSKLAVIIGRQTTFYIDRGKDNE